MVPAHNMMKCLILCVLVYKYVKHQHQKVRLEDQRRRLRVDGNRPLRTKRKPDDFKIHNGPGIWDDFKVLFYMESRRKFTRLQIKYLEKEFQSNFRLTVKSFIYVANAIRPSLVRQPGARGPEPTPCELQLAICLYQLATGFSHKAVALAFRNSLSTAHVLRTMRTVPKAIHKHLNHLICFPSTRSQMEAIASVFERRTLIPGMIGAIDCSHIRVTPRRRDQGSYMNRKGFCSVILSAVCDYRGYFMSVDTGFPGRMADSTV